MIFLGNGATERKYKDEEKYLDISKLKEFEQITTIAYVHDVSVGRTKMESGFVKLFLKDCNSNVVSAILFDVENFVFSGINIMQFKHRAVQLRCLVQNFKGQISLLIDGETGIKLYDDEFDYNRFVGRMDSDLSIVTEDAKRLVADFIDVESWKNTQIDEIASGAIGAYGRVVELAYCKVDKYAGYFAGDDARDLRMSFLVTAEWYFRYLKKQQFVSVVGAVTAYPCMQAISQVLENDNCKIVALDSFSAVVGLSAPKHLFAHLINNAFSSVLLEMKLINRYGSMPVATTVYVGGVELSKY